MGATRGEAIPTKYYWAAPRCQKTLLNADVRRASCNAVCAKFNDRTTRSAECYSRCKRKFQSNIKKPLECTGDRLVHHVVVPANSLIVDIGVDILSPTRVSIIAVGKWSTGGAPNIGPEGRAKTDNDPNARTPFANIGELIVGFDEGPVWPVGEQIEYDFEYMDWSKFPMRIYLSTNDLTWDYGNNQGFLDVSIMVNGPSSVTLDVPAAGGLQNTRVFTNAGTHFTIESWGCWSNSGPGCIGPDGFYRYPFPGTLLPGDDLAALIGDVNGTLFPVGSFMRGSYPESSPLYLGMNDVVGTYGDNQGKITATISVGNDVL